MSMRVRATALLLAVAPLAACADTAADGAIYLGVAGPIQLPNGRGMQRAAEMAVEEINARGGVRGRPLALVVKDDEGRAERAIEVAAALRDDPRVVAVIGHINSAATLAAAKVYNDEARGVVEISPASSSPLVSGAGPWTFRVCPSDLLHGPALARWAYEKLGRRRAAVLYSNDEYGRGVLETFGEAFERAGGTIVARDPYLTALIDSETALDPYLERAIRNGMDVLMIAGQADGGLRILAAARRLGYSGPVIGADGMTGIKDAGPIAEGVLVSSAFLPDRDTPAAREFVRAYRERYQELPDHRAAMTYDAVRLIARALEAVGPNRRAIRDYLARVGRDEPAFEGVSGTIAFDANGDVAGKEVYIGAVRGGQLVSAGR